MQQAHRRFQSSLSWTFVCLAALLSACSSNNDIVEDGNPGDEDLRPPGQLLDAQGSGAPLQVDLPGRMSVLVQVLTDDNQPVSGLTADNFRLFEDGSLVSPSESQQRLLARPRVFRSYSHLLLDLSGSVAQTPAGLQNELEAAHRFVDEVTTSEENFVAISWFFGSPDIAPALRSDLTELGFTNQAALLHEAIDNVGLVQVTSTSTNLYGAFIQGLDALDAARLESEDTGIEFTSLALVTFTDGSDQAGLVPRTAALARLNDGPLSYSALTIGLGSEIDEETLNLLGPSGFSFAGDESSLAATFAAVGGEVRNLANSFYLVGYVSPKVDGSGTHVLTVEAFANGGSAMRDYPFDAAFFSGGGGFLNVIDLDREAARTAASAAAQVADGRLLISGATDIDGSGDRSLLWIARRDTDGGPDPDFGPGIAGQIEIESIGPFDTLAPAGLIAQEDGSGWALVAVSDFLGSSDQRAAIVAFGSTGSVQDAVLLDQITAEPEVPMDLVRSTDGKLLVLSRVGTAPGTRTLLRRLDSTSLAPDPAFAGGGAVLLAADSMERREEPRALTQDADGRLVLVGGSYNAAASLADMAITCLMPNGALDTSFGTDGRTFHRTAFDASSNAFAADVSVDEAGRIVVAGAIQSDPVVGSGVLTAAWWQLDSAGEPSLTFTGNASNPYLGTGLVSLGGALTGSPGVLFGAQSSATTLQLRPGGSLLSAGTRTNARGDQDLCYWSLSAAGVFRQNFNATGFLIEDGTGGQGSSESVSAMWIHPSGRVFALGTTLSASSPATRRRATLWEDREADRVFAPFGTN